MVGYQSLTSGVSQVQTLLSAQDPGLVASLLEVLVVLWRSVQKALDHNKEAQHYTLAKFGAVMSKYFNTFEVSPGARCCPPVVTQGITTTQTAKTLCNTSFRNEKIFTFCFDTKNRIITEIIFSNRI